MTAAKLTAEAHARNNPSTLRPTKGWQKGPTWKREGDRDVEWTKTSVRRRDEDSNVRRDGRMGLI